MLVMLIFTTVGTDMKRRYIYTYPLGEFDWYITSCFTFKMTLESAGLYLGSNVSISK